MRYPSSLSVVLVAVAITGCNSVPGDPDTNLTIMGSAGAPPTAQQASASAHARPSLGVGTTDVTSGDPASVGIGMYALWLGRNADCSDAVLVQDYGSTPVVKDFVTNPVLFTGTPEAGSYHCVAIKMSDVIDFTSASSFGTCVAGTAYEQDIYRDGESDWLDLALAQIVGHGSDEAPADDGVTVVITTDPAAAEARGFSSNQIVQLQGPLTVPGSSTFYWNGQGSVTTQDGRPCGLMPGQPAFE